MKLLLFLALALSAADGKPLFRVLDAVARRGSERCHEASLLSCDRVALDVDALVNEEKVTLPQGLELTRRVSRLQSTVGKY